MSYIYNKHIAQKIKFEKMKKNIVYLLLVVTTASILSCASTRTDVLYDSARLNDFKKKHNTSGRDDFIVMDTSLPETKDITTLWQRFYKERLFSKGKDSIYQINAVFISWKKPSLLEKPAWVMDLQH